MPLRETGRIRSIIAGVAAVVILACSARAADQRITLTPVSTISGFSGRIFRNMQGFWLDQEADSFYVVDTSPGIVGQFDRRQGMPVRYTAIDEEIKTPEFVGVSGGVLYLKSEGRTLEMAEGFTMATDAEFFFVPPPQPDVEPPAVPEKFPLDFSIILTGPEGTLIGFDPVKKNVYQCDAARECKVFIRTLMKYGNDIMTGKVQSIYRDSRGYYYLVDAEGKQVWKFDSDGRYAGRVMQMIDIDRDRLYRPELVAVDRTRRVYIYDAAVRTLKVYDELGLFVSDVNLQDAAAGVFLNLPAAMDIDDYGRLYIWDRGDMTVKIFQIKDGGF